MGAGRLLKRCSQKCSCLLSPPCKRKGRLVPSHDAHPLHARAQKFSRLHSLPSLRKFDSVFWIIVMTLFLFRLKFELSVSDA